VSSSGFTIAAAGGSSSYRSENPRDPLPKGCFQRAVDQAIARAAR